MRTHDKQPQRQSRTLDANPKASRQAPIEVILQKYAARNNIVQREAIPDEEELLQGKFETAQRESLEDEEEPIQQKADNKTGLPDDLKEGVENLSGFSMDDVRVHYNSDKPAQLNALAYAQGTDIHVGPGQEKHLPHEAWHVVQQKQGRVKPTVQMQGVQVNDNEGLENEAEYMGNSAFIRKKPVSISKNKNTNSSNILQLFNINAGIPAMMEGETITSFNCPSEWRVHGATKGYTNYHTVAYSLLCQAVTSLIVGNTIPNAISNLFETITYYYSQIIEGNGRATNSVGEAKQVVAQIGELKEPFTIIDVMKFAHGLLHLQQHFKAAFHVEGGGDVSSSGEQLAIQNLRGLLGEIQSNSLPIEQYDEILLKSVVEAFITLLDLRGTANRREDLVFYALDIFDQLFTPVLANIEEEEEEDDDDDEIDLADFLSGNLSDSFMDDDTTFSLNVRLEFIQRLYGAIYNVLYSKMELSYEIEEDIPG